MVPRENENNACAKFGGTKKSIMVFPKWPIKTAFQLTNSGLGWNLFHFGLVEITGCIHSHTFDASSLSS